MQGLFLVSVKITITIIQLAIFGFVFYLLKVIFLIGIGPENISYYLFIMILIIILILRALLLGYLIDLHLNYNTLDLKKFLLKKILLSIFFSLILLQITIIFTDLPNIIIVGSIFSIIGNIINYNILSHFKIKRLKGENYIFMITC